MHDFFTFSNKLTSEKYNLDEHNSKHSKAVGLNDEATIKQSLEKFHEMHNNIIKEIEEKFPLNTIKLEFEQLNNDQVDVSQIVISKYQFPWDTAIRLSYLISFDCKIVNSKPVNMVRFEFHDTDNDIFLSSNTAVYQNGTYTFEIRPEIEFFNFQKIVVTVIE